MMQNADGMYYTSNQAKKEALFSTVEMWYNENASLTERGAGMDQKQVLSMFSASDYWKGMDYYKRGLVEKIWHKEINQTTTEISGLVMGTIAYSARLTLRNDQIVQRSCTCPRCREWGSCKHLAAVMIEYVETVESQYKKSDSAAQQMLTTYLTKAQRQTEAPQRLAHIVPRLVPEEMDSYPSFSFLVGYDKLYAVRNIEHFLNAVSQEKTETYGKGLTLNHSMEQFDARSQKIIQLLMNEFPQFHSVGSYGYYRETYGYSYRKNEIRLRGDAFDRMFDLLKDEPLATTDKGLIHLEERDPEITVRIEKKKKNVNLLVETEETFTYFGSNRCRYLIGDERLLRCSKQFSEKVGPLIKSGRNKMALSFDDLPTFCSCVLPEISGMVKIVDSGNLLQEYVPEDCTVRFYFDMDRETLTLAIAFVYGEHSFTSADEPNDRDGVRRNLRQEKSAVSFAERFFEHDAKDRLVIRNEDAIYDFLSSGIDSFREHGEVYVSSRLQNRRVSPAPAKIGVSVSDGLLTLSMDAGGFPPEELSALYESMLLRKRYHRLADGRYMPIDGSSCEKLAEMTQMLQLSPKEMKSGSIKLPAYRGLYLDSMLTGNDGIQVSRDTQFRAMIRNFKTLSESDYATPPDLTASLRSYQLTGYQWLKTLESYGFGGILADEMGLGKTLQAIAFLDTVRNERVGIPNLVVCPASLIYNWGDEMQKFAPQMKYALILGNAAERREKRQGAADADVWVTSYELLRQDIEDYAALSFYCCVLDEAQHIKNSTTLVSKSVKRIMCRQRFVLTGTPIENRLSELWNLFDFMMPGYLFSHHAFVEKLEKPIVKSKNSEAMSQLRRLVQPFMLRRLKADVLKELPAKQEYVRRISLSEEEQKIYFANVQATLSGIHQGEDKLQILAALTRLRQVCCDPNLCYENYTGATSKLDACVELCEEMVENKHQILLFSQFTSMLERLRNRLDAAGISNFTLQGSTSKERRAELVKAFNAGEASVFLISLKAGGTGLNLTAADVVIHFDPWWNQAAQDQATDRAHRIGQMAHVQVYKLIAKDTIEEKILELQEQKNALLDTVSGGEAGGIMNMSTDELMSLLKI